MPNLLVEARGRRGESFGPRRLLPARAWLAFPSRNVIGSGPEMQRCVSKVERRARFGLGQRDSCSRRPVTADSWSVDMCTAQVASCFILGLFELQMW